MNCKLWESLRQRRTIYTTSLPHLHGFTYRARASKWLLLMLPSVELCCITSPCASRSISSLVVADLGYQEIVALAQPRSERWRIQYCVSIPARLRLRTVHRKLVAQKQRLQIDSWTPLLQILVCIERLWGFCRFQGEKKPTKRAWASKG